MADLLLYAQVFWPFVTLLSAFLFYRKQNSKTAWTGGRISWQKSLWLWYAILFWFIYPFFLIADEKIEDKYLGVFLAHLLSWWLRGPLELLMIYKWLNWKPLYGISHDLFHFFLILAASLYLDVFSSETHPFHWSCQIFILCILISTAAETYFAIIFSQTRSQEETKDHVYFAAQTQKWKSINRLTGGVVLWLIALQFVQSYLLFSGN